MAIKLFCYLILLVVVVTDGKDLNQHKEKRVKRDSGLTEAIIGAAIEAGASLAGTTVGGLQSPSYTVSVSGSIENYSKWPLHFKGCEIASGYMNVPMRSVSPGQREGFASHKTANTATVDMGYIYFPIPGSWVRCSFIINNAMVHFMYSAPYSFDLHVNTMAVAVCPSNDHSCKGFTAKKLYYSSNSFSARRQYYYDVYTLTKCNMGICISGVMGTNHKPEIDLKVMPQSYDDLCSVAKDASLKDRWSKSDYEKFVNQQ